MTACSMTGASSTCIIPWFQINWKQVELQVRRLQMRIAKAIQQEKHGKVKSLQWILTHSYNAKLLAVKRVTQNTGAKTPGVDRTLWKTPKQKYHAALSLQRKGYKAQPLRRITIPKKGGKQRPLGIPTMKDRAMQALHLLALEPIAEIKADRHSYGFRPKRSVADAIQQSFLVLSRKQAAQWVLEGDIKACFDTINHRWLLNHIPMDTVPLKQWLAAGYIKENVFYKNEEGTPQGGIISPTLANITLDGLQQVITKVTKITDKVNFVRYADDFIITGKSKEILEDRVRPAVVTFLAERGLELSKEKTTITHIDKGFDFLGFNIRKYDGKLLIKPAKKSIKTFLATIRTCIKSKPTIKTENLIRLLNPKLSGWAHFYRHVVSKEVFCKADHAIFKSIWRWTKRRHPQKGAHWLKKKYFSHPTLKILQFNAKISDKKKRFVIIKLFKLAHISIKRHVKVRADASPYNPEYVTYFQQREKREQRMGQKKSGADNSKGCWVK